VTEPWPRLPRGAVESPSLEIFQPRLAAVLCPLLWVTLLGQGVGLGDPQRSLPAPTILWFCELLGLPRARLAGREEPRSPLGLAQSSVLLVWMSLGERLRWTSTLGLGHEATCPRELHLTLLPILFLPRWRSLVQEEEHRWDHFPAGWGGVEEQPWARAGTVSRQSCRGCGIPSAPRAFDSVHLNPLEFSRILAACTIAPLAASAGGHNSAPACLAASRVRKTPTPPDAPLQPTRIPAYKGSCTAGRLSHCCLSGKSLFSPCFGARIQPGTLVLGCCDPSVVSRAVSWASSAFLLPLESTSRRDHVRDAEEGNR